MTPRHLAAIGLWAAFAVAAPAFVRAECPNFDAAVNYPSGGHPFAVVTADFNGDSKQDLAVANGSDNDVSIFLGNGDGTFQAPSHITVGTNPVALAVGDFNHDNKIDLAVANSGSSNVSILLGNGDGTFQSSSTVAAGSGGSNGPRSISTGNFNGDAHIDLVTGNSNGGYTIVLGDGAGGFTSSQGTSLPVDRAISVIARDFNGDAKDDLVFANYENIFLTVLIGNGNGTFQSPVTYGTGSWPTSVTSGDFNDDGKPDLATSNEASANVSVLFGNGNGTFMVNTNYPAGANPESIATADFNGDSKADLVVANFDGHASILLNNGNGTFAAPFSVATGTNSISVVAGSFNGDAKPDLAVANYGSNDVSVVAGGCTGVGLTKTHTGNFGQGQTGATYTLTAVNFGPSSTSGLVSVTDLLPSSLTATSMSGSGWSCDLPSLTCTRSDVLAVGGTYPSITLTVNVAVDAPATVTNIAQVTNANKVRSASDATQVTQHPDLTIAKTHQGNFAKGQSGATYTIVVRNAGHVASTGTITVTDTLPSGLSLATMSGSGWTCNPANLTCTRNDLLAANSSYPVISLTVSVNANAPAAVTNAVSVSAAAGEINTGNNSASDPTTITESADLAITKTHGRNFSPGETGATYTISVRNVTGVPTNGQVAVTDQLPAGLTATAIAGSGWTCDLPTLTCTRSDALGAYASYLPITLSVNVASTIQGSVVNTAHVSLAGDSNPSNDTASDPTTITGRMSSPRSHHAATLLTDGKLLITGGSDGSTVLSSAELYDPATNTFRFLSAAMTSPRRDHTATLLRNGKVLIAGGSDGTNSLSSAEIFDPADETFTAVTSLTFARAHHTATLLANGNVLVAGGFNGTPLDSAELFDSSANSFSTTGSMSSARTSHTAILLLNGDVLIAGGTNGASVLNTAEVYSAASFSPVVATMTSARSQHTATLLPNGKVLIAGGNNGTATVNSAELYDAGTFTATGVMSSPHESHTATLLQNGKIVVAGGMSGSTPLSSIELFDPSAQTFSLASSSLIAARAFHTATLLANANVIFAGGASSSVDLASTEIYGTSSGSFAATGTMAMARVGFTMTALANGNVLLAGSAHHPFLINASAAHAELFHPVTGTFTATSQPMNTPRTGHTGTLLPNGKVLIAGGYDHDYSTATAERYDPVTDTFSPTAQPLPFLRSSHTATLLSDGNVLIAGGQAFINGTAQLPNTAALYNSQSDTFALLPATMTTPRVQHSATLLPSGKVLVAGGNTTFEPSPSAELYDPANGTFTPTSSPMVVRRVAHTATLLEDGTVLIAGGSSSAGVTNTAEIYDPNADTFTPLSSVMTSVRFGHTATMLPNGKVLIAGGTIEPGNLDSNTAEVFDPIARTFTAVSGTMSSTRVGHRATLLSNGRILVAGGSASNVDLNTAELFAATSFSNLRRPGVFSITNPLCQPGTFALSGAFLTSDSEASSGGTNNSASNIAVLRLQSVDSEQLAFVRATSFSATNFLSATFSPLNSGHYRASIVSNAIPSIEQFVRIETTPVVATYPTASVLLSGSTTVTPASIPLGFDGTRYPQTVSAPAQFTGTISLNRETGTISVTNAGPAGDWTITIGSANVCGSASSTFTLQVIGAASSISATGGTPQSTMVNTQFAQPLQATVRDQAGHGVPNISVTWGVPAQSGPSAFLSAGTVITDSNGNATVTATANGIAGNYTVAAAITSSAPMTTFDLTNTPFALAPPPNLVATAISTSQVALTWDAVAGATHYQVLRKSNGSGFSIVGLPTTTNFTDTSLDANTAYIYEVTAADAGNAGPPSNIDLATTILFTDDSIVAGSTPIRAVHVTELRTAVNAVRGTASLPAATFTNSVTPGAFINAIDISELRTALDQARATLGLPAVPYEEPTLTSGVVVKAAHIGDLRTGVR